MTVSMAGVYPERLPYFASRDTSSTILCTVHKEKQLFLHTRQAMDTRYMLFVT